MSELLPRSLARHGRCYVVGSDIAIDDGVVPARFAAQRVTDPDELAAHLFETLDPSFAQRVRRGDIILAGRNFMCGKPRVQGLIALSALGLSVVCMSMPYKILRRAVASAIPVIVGAPASDEIATDGDELEIDFASGGFVNFTRGTRGTLPAMPPILANIVAGGGMQAVLKAWLAVHPEQALSELRR